MTRDDIIRKARESGLVVEPCVSEDHIAVRVGEAVDSNERMRLTADMQLLVVNDGYYWQVGTVEDLANAIRARGDK